MEIIDNDLLRHFETIIDGQLVTLEYSIQEHKIFFTKLNNKDGKNEEKIEEFLKKVFKIAAENKKRIVPTQADVVKFMKKYPEYQEQLAIGIKI